MQTAGGPPRYVREADFVIILTGGAVIAGGHGSQLYDESVQDRFRSAILDQAGLKSTELLPFNHLPLEALLSAPFQSAGFDPVLLFTAWTALNVLAFLGAFLLLSRGWSLEPQSALRWLILSLLFFPLLLSILLGQDTGLMVLGSAACTVALRRGRDGWAGAACLLLALKPPAVPVLLLALLVMRRWRALAVFGGASVGAYLLALPWLGWRWPLAYGQLLVRFALSGPSSANPARNQNWLGLCDLLLGNGRSAIVVAGVVSVIGFLAVVHIWWGAHGLALATASWQRRWCFTLIVALLINPHVLPHDLTLALVPGTLLLAEAVQRKSVSLTLWLATGWVAGAAAVFAPTLLPLPAVYWLTLTALWLYSGRVRERRGTALQVAVTPDD